MLATHNLMRNLTYRPYIVSLCFRSGRRPCIRNGFNLPDATGSSRPRRLLNPLWNNSRLGISSRCRSIQPSFSYPRAGVRRPQCPENTTVAYNHSQAFLPIVGGVSSIVREFVRQWTNIICFDQQDVILTVSCIGFSFEREHKNRPE